MHVNASSEPNAVPTLQHTHPQLTRNVQSRSGLDQNCSGLLASDDYVSPASKIGTGRNLRICEIHLQRLIDVSERFEDLHLGQEFADGLLSTLLYLRPEGEAKIILSNLFIQRGSRFDGELVRQVRTCSM